MLVEAAGLTKRFGAFTAVDGIDFQVLQGEAFGFLGPNGAGKSSTMRMVAASRRSVGARCGSSVSMPPRRAPASALGWGWSPSRTAWTRS